jgi:FkbM family methyltransferase
MQNLPTKQVRKTKATSSLLFKMKQTKVFIEIGTSNFNTLEVLAEQGWSGIFVEPDKWYLSQIKRFKHCLYDNSAILDFNGETEFVNYDADWLSNNEAGDFMWKRGVGNTHPTINNMKLNPEWPTVKFNVQVKTLNKLIEEYGVDQIDFLKIDIEGQDPKVLYAYDFCVRPNKIKMEIIHANSYGINTKDFKNYMLKNNYSVYCEDDYDTQDIWFFDNFV